MLVSQQRLFVYYINCFDLRPRSWRFSHQLSLFASKCNPKIKFYDSGETPRHNNQSYSQPYASDPNNNAARKIKSILTNNEDINISQNYTESYGGVIPI